MNIALTGKRALVTGASRGIGAAIARELAAAGAAVAVNYLRSAEPAQCVAEEIRAAGGTAFPVAADVGRCADVARMFAEVEAALGPIDILVNNAGIEVRRPTLEFDEATYDAILDTNLKGAFFCAQRAIPAMQARGWGRIINISSVHEDSPTGFCTPYSLSKGGLRMLTRELARDFSRCGITVNNVCPGAIRTDINRAVLSDPQYEARVSARIPAGFIGEPLDVARLVVFLAAEQARYITGASLTIDGGLVL